MDSYPNIFINNKINNMSDLICGTKFIEMGKHIYCPPTTEANYYNLTHNFVLENIQERDIIYAYTHSIHELFAEIKNLNKRVIVVTHNSDYNIGEIEIPDCVIKWYSQNVNFIHPKLESVPIGLENHERFPYLQKHVKILNKPREEKTFKNLLYINHSVWTNKTEREEPYSLLENKPWCTAIRGSLNADFDGYIDNIYNHKFMLSPQGNGMDTHRLWETLYLNTIPIEKRNTNNQFYTDLPICFVNDWSEITEEFLNTEYDRIMNMNWNWNKLTFTYWLYKITQGI